MFSPDSLYLAGKVEVEVAEEQEDYRESRIITGHPVSDFLYWDWRTNRCLSTSKHTDHKRYTVN